MEYKETVRAVSDNILADIYKLRSSKAYLILICEISHGKKKLIASKLRYEQEGYNYQSIKDDIRENFLNKAYLISHPIGV